MREIFFDIAVVGMLIANWRMFNNRKKVKCFPFCGKKEVALQGFLNVDLVDEEFIIRFRIEIMREIFQCNFVECKLISRISCKI